MNEREKLIEELELINLKNGGLISISVLADFIVRDRLRIVKPLVNIHKTEFILKELNQASIETLKNAGIE